MGGVWVTGTGGGTRRDEHWWLCYMLANGTPIKNMPPPKKKERKMGKKRRTAPQRLWGVTWRTFARSGVCGPCPGYTRGTGHPPGAVIAETRQEEKQG